MNEAVLLPRGHHCCQKHPHKLSFIYYLYLNLFQYRLNRAISAKIFLILHCWHNFISCSVWQYQFRAWSNQTAFELHPTGTYTGTIRPTSLWNYHTSGTLSQMVAAADWNCVPSPHRDENSDSCGHILTAAGGERNGKALTLLWVTGAIESYYQGTVASGFTVHESISMAHPAVQLPVVYF